MDSGDSGGGGGGGGAAAAAAAKWRSDASRAFQYYLDRSTPHATGRWVGTLAVAAIYALRVYMVHGFYIVSYGLGIYLLNLLIGFLSPMVDPELDPSAAADGPALPTRGSDEFKPFIRRLPEFKFWFGLPRSFNSKSGCQVRNHKSFCCSFCDDIFLCIRCSCLLAHTSLLLDRPLCPDNEAPDSAYGQVQICTFQYREAEIWREEGWGKQQFFERLIPSLPWWEEWKGEKIQLMLFHVLNTKCNTPFISRVRRMFTYVSDMGSRFNLIFVLECFLLSVYSVILLSDRRSVARNVAAIRDAAKILGPAPGLDVLFMYHVYAPSFTC